MAVLDILNNPDGVLRMRIVVYGLLFFFSFFIFVGVAVMKDEAHPWDCPLYIDNLIEQPPVSNCDFPLAIAIMFQLLYILFRLGTLLMLLIGKMTPDSMIFTDMMDFAWVVTDFFGFFFTFIGACLLSAGTNESCDYLADKTNNDDYCSDTQDWYSPSQAAQAGSWLSTLLWLLVFIVGFLSMYRMGRIPFLGGTSMPNTKAAASAGTGTPSSPDQQTPPGNPDTVQTPKY